MYTNAHVYLQSQLLKYEIKHSTKNSELVWMRKRKQGHDALYLYVRPRHAHQT